MMADGFMLIGGLCVVITSILSTQEATVSLEYIEDKKVLKNNHILYIIEFSGGANKSM